MSDEKVEAREELGSSVEVAEEAAGKTTVEAAEEDGGTRDAAHGDDANADHEEGDKPAPKKPSRKKVIIGAVIAVIAVLGFGFYQWHETPEFCTAICHTPMNDVYRQTLYANPYEASVDKWGNEVKKADAMLASKHGAMGKRCMACHVPAIEEQVTEGIEWITGNYYNPLSERDLARLVFYRHAGETEFCLNKGCHNITQSGLTEETANMSRNPHSWHHSEYTCSDCHKAHRASVMICTQCHDDVDVPDGWLTAEEAKNLETQYMSWNEEQFLKA